MKIVFIKPNMIQGTPSDSIEPLVFAILSALTPNHIERVFHDERLAKIPFDDPADLVAISADVFSAKRAYQIAAVYRAKGVPVAIGGYHPSLMPEESAEHVDSVVIGDAEDTWPELIYDLENGAVKPLYQSSYPEFGHTAPDKSVFKGKSYAPINLVERIRGCRFSCDFCSIHAMYMGTTRRKSKTNLLRDVNASLSKHIIFTDDNFFSDLNSLRETLLDLAKRNVTWSCQISADISKHPDLIAMMSKAGCVSVTIGFESIDRGNLEQMGKTWMIEDYERVINLFHTNGIMVYATFVFGYDFDTENIFAETLEFVNKHRLAMANFNPLFPIPGTPLLKRLKNENRLLIDDWWLNDDFRWGDAVFKPKQMSGKELTDGCRQIRKIFFGFKSVAKRFPGLPLSKATLRTIGLYLLSNWICRRELNRKYGKPLGAVAGKKK